MKVIKLVKTTMCAGLLFVSQFAVANMLNNIKPMGQVDIADESTPVALAVIEEHDVQILPVDGDQVVTLARAEEIYNTTCAICHAAGVAGAPIYGNQEQWEHELAETGKETLDEQLDVLVATVVTGKGAMPPMGTCMSCSEDELRAAIEYMLP